MNGQARLCPNMHRDANGLELSAPELRPVRNRKGDAVLWQCPMCLRTYEMVPGFRELVGLCGPGIRLEQAMRYLGCGKGQAMATMRQFERGRLVVRVYAQEAGVGKRKRKVVSWVARGTDTTTPQGRGLNGKAMA